ncbi:hypothetical protein AGLY_008332 [Aphis glycines]|uniref:Uncharacterized protein n=1 Tax=Aphis glycines TaxID=307491 RepID=A0A6G0TNT6_APHGL|nr:hypothetical protein AGLY_008332 [Aphis glycines]
MLMLLLLSLYGRLVTHHELTYFCRFKITKNHQLHYTDRYWFFRNIIKPIFLLISQINILGYIYMLVYVCRSGFSNSAYRTYGSGRHTFSIANLFCLSYYSSLQLTTSRNLGLKECSSIAHTFRPFNASTLIRSDAQIMKEKTMRKMGNGNGMDGELGSSENSLSLEINLQ